jgi:hypothetical protein
MTESQAKALREQWKQHVHPVPCEHANLELEKNEKGYLTGHYHCAHCGDAVPREAANNANGLPPSDPLPC